MDAEIRRSETYQEINQFQIEALSKLESIWSYVGVRGETKTKRLRDLSTRVLRIFQDMVDEEERNKMIIVQRIEQLREDLSKLRKELSGETSCPPDEGLGNAPLFQVEMCLREKIELFQKVKEERHHQLDELQRKLEDVQYRLGKKDISPYTGGVTEVEMNALKCRVTRLEQERDLLQSSYEETQSAIQQIFRDLKKTASLPFENTVLSTPPDAFVLSAENMAAVKKLHQNMEESALNAKIRAEKLRESLSNCWEHLQFSSHFREEFLQAHSGYCPSTITALESELKKSEYVAELRSQLCSWWDCNHTAQSSRDKFKAILEPLMNEDVTKLYELEVDKLKNFYEKNRGIFILAEQRTQCLQDLKVLHERENDPNRYINRGGQLLRDDKERKILKKNLPKIESELEELLIAYEQENFSPFLMEGKNFLESIHQENEERERLKKERNNLLEVYPKVANRATSPTGRLSPAMTIKRKAAVSPLSGCKTCKGNLK